MDINKSHHSENQIESIATTHSDQQALNEILISKKDSDTQRRLQSREALKAFRCTSDSTNSFKIDMGNNLTIEDRRPGSMLRTEALPSTPPTQEKIINYPLEKISKNVFSPGLDFEDNQAKSSNSKGSNKMEQFLQAAARRAANQEGWKIWMQDESDKFTGIGVGLNDAKNETKKSVAAGWRALTDGTVATFLSHPNALNEPISRYVSNVFKKMEEDPNAANEALNCVVDTVSSASRHYDALSAYEKGKIIGNVMFALVNPEGNTESGEAAMKLASNIATGVDKATATTVEASLAAIKNMDPHAAAIAKKGLYDFIKSKGLSATAMEDAGELPRAYFQGVAGKGGDWPTLNERISPDVVQQTEKMSCVSAVGEMLSNGALDQASLIKQLGAPAELKKLAEVLGPPWEAHAVKPESLDTLLRRGKAWGAELREIPSNISYHRLGPAHSIVVDGVDESGKIVIRDPADGTRYEMTRKDFLKHWDLNALYER